MLRERNGFERELRNLHAGNWMLQALEREAADFSALTDSERKAIAFTTTMETGMAYGLGKPSGNFDGYGLSFGPLQWNIGAGSLQPLLLHFIDKARNRFNSIFGADAKPLEAMLRTKSKSDQLQWTIDNINDVVTKTIATGKNKGKTRTTYQLKAQWRQYFDSLAREPVYRAAAAEKIRTVVHRAAGYCEQLGLTSERALVLAFDGMAWPGPYWLSVLDTKRRKSKRKSVGARALSAQLAAAEKAKAAPLTEAEKLAIVAESMAALANSRWREKALTRKMSIVLNKDIAGRVKTTRLNILDAPFQSSRPLPKDKEYWR